MTETLATGTHLIVLSESYPMNTNIAGLSLSIGRVNINSSGIDTFKILTIR